MDEQKKPSRRQFMTQSALAAAAAAAAVGGLASSEDAQAAAGSTIRRDAPTAAEVTIKSNVPREKWSREWVERDRAARQAVAVLQKLDPTLQFEWEDGKQPQQGRIPGRRRIIQIKG